MTAEQNIRMDHQEFGKPSVTYDGELISEDKLPNLILRKKPGAKGYRYSFNIEITNLQPFPTHLNITYTYTLSIPELYFEISWEGLVALKMESPQMIKFVTALIAKKVPESIYRQNEGFISLVHKTIHSMCIKHLTKLNQENRLGLPGLKTYRKKYMLTKQKIENLKH
jgi:hypothetical protein